MIPPPHQVPDAWDFYLCRVEEASASITLNFWYREVAPVAQLGTRYWCRIAMRDVGDHGMGTASEAHRLNIVEDAIFERAETEGLHPVGRLRGSGGWRLVLYGPAGRLGQLDAIAKEVIGRDPEREAEVGSKPDPGWHYFRDLLCPDEERGQWIQDRRVVEALMEAGDRLATPRPVWHWIYFADAGRRDAFVDASRERGFELEASWDDGKPPNPHAAKIRRTDAVELPSIHATVMGLIDLAKAHQGDYDGWETSVES